MVDEPWEVPENPPKKPDTTNALNNLRFVDPQDPTKLCQLSLADTGTWTPDGLRIYALSIGGSGGSGSAILIAGLDDILSNPTTIRTLNSGELLTVMKNVLHRWYKTPPGIYMDEEREFRATSRIVDQRGLNSIGGYSMALPVAITGRGMGPAVDDGMTLAPGEIYGTQEVDLSFCEEFAGGIETFCESWEMEIFVYVGKIFSGYRMTYYEKKTGALPMGESNMVIPFWIKPNGDHAIITFKNTGGSTADMMIGAIRRA